MGTATTNDKQDTLGKTQSVLGCPKSNHFKIQNNRSADQSIFTPRFGPNKHLKQQNSKLTGFHNQQFTNTIQNLVRYKLNFSKG